MKLFLDENLSYSLVGELEKLGFEVKHVRDVKLQGATDLVIAKYARCNNSILITKDIEFGSLLKYPLGTHYGLIVLRLPYTFKTTAIIKSLKSLLTQLKEQCIGNMIILEVGRYRIRNIANPKSN